MRASGLLHCVVGRLNVWYRFVWKFGALRRSSLRIRRRNGNARRPGHFALGGCLFAYCSRLVEIHVTLATLGEDFRGQVDGVCRQPRVNAPTVDVGALTLG